jgi:hypothetical protein
MADAWDDQLLPGQVERSSRKAEASDRQLLLMIIGGCTVAGLLIFGCAGLVIWSFFGSWEATVAEQETPEQRRAALHAAFNASDVGVIPEQFAEFDRLFQNIQAAEDDATFRKYIDGDRMFDEMKATGRLPLQSRLFESEVRATILPSVYIPWYVERYRIARIELEPDAQEAVVYGYFWDYSDHLAEMRWWAVRDQGEWKVYDWELLQFGTRASLDLANWQAGVTDSYYEVMEELYDAYDGFMTADAAVGRKRVERAEALLPSVHADLRDEATLWTAYYWSYGNEFEDAARVAGLVAAPDEHPGVYYLKMLRHQELHEYEQVLECCRLYEEALGPSPLPASFRITALNGLGRLNEAAEACRNYLRVDPEKTDILRQYAVSLRPDDKPRLAELVSSSRDPAATAASLAETLAATGDIWALDVLADLATESQSGTGGIVPELAATDRVLSWRASQEQAAAILAAQARCHGDLTRQADYLHQAWSLAADDTSRANYMWQYLEVMTNLDRIVEGYSAVASKSADDAFAHLTNAYEEGMSSYLEPDVLRALLEAHRPRAQDDPWWYFHAGDLASQEGDSARAAELYAEGAALARRQADDETGDSEWAFAGPLAAAQIEAGQTWLTAYEAADDRPAKFQALASALRQAARWDDLRRLLERHRELQSDDAMADYYGAVLALESGDFNTAEKLLKEGREKLAADAEQSWQDWQFRQLQVEARIKAGTPLTAYDDFLPRPDTFGQLATHFSQHGDLDSLALLSDRMRSDEPTASVGWSWSAYVRAYRDDDEGVVELLSQRPWESAETPDDYQWSECRRYLFRSLLKLGRTDEALQLASEGTDAATSSNELIVAHVVAGNRERVAELLTGSEQYRYNTVYSDELAGPILRSPEYHEIREQSPPPLPWIESVSWVALFREPPQWTDDDVRTRVTAALGPDAAVATLDLNGQNGRTFAVNIGEFPLQISVGDDRYHDPQSLSGTDITDPDLLQAVESHRGWITFTSASQGPAHPDATRFLKRLARGFQDERMIALYDWNQDLLAPAGEALDRALTDDSSLTDWAPHSHAVALWRTGSEMTPAQLEWLRGRVRTIAHHVYHDHIECEVTVQVSVGFAQESITATLERVTPGEYGSWEYVARLTSNSQLISWLVSGDPVHLDEYDIMDWRATIDGVERHGAAEAAAWWDSLSNSPGPAQAKSSTP